MRLFIAAFMWIAMSASAQAKNLTLTIVAEVRAPNTQEFVHYWTAEAIEFSAMAGSCEFDSGIEHHPHQCSVKTHDGDSMTAGYQILTVEKRYFDAMWFNTSYNQDISKELKKMFNRNLRDEETTRNPIEIDITKSRSGSQWVRTFSSKYGEHGTSRITVIQN